MTEPTLTRLYIARELNKAKTTRLTGWTVATMGSIILAIGMIGYDQGKLSDSGGTALYLFGALLIVTGTGFIVLGNEAYRKIKPCVPKKPTGQPQRESSRNRPRTITINASHDTRRLEVKDANTIYLGDIGMSRSEWHRLTVALRDNPKGRWNWSRSILIDTGIFTGLTVGSRYNDVTKSFEDAQAVKVWRDGAGKISKAHVTEQGIEALHAAAGMRVVTA